MGCSEWNLVQFNLPKTQGCVFIAKKDPFIMAPQFQGVAFHIADNIGILGVKISSKVQFWGHLEDKDKLTSRMLGDLNRTKQYT